MTDLLRIAKNILPDAVTETAVTTPPERFEFPREVGYDFWDWLRRWLGVPNIQWTEFNSTWKGWHYVRFGAAFPMPPSVVAVCSGFRYDLLVIPSLPEWTRPDYAAVYRERFADWFRGIAGDWGLFNWLRDALADYFLGPLGWVVGAATNLMWDISLKPHADRWNTEIVYRFNSAMADIHDKLLNLVRGLGVTPLAVRNVGTDGCEVYCPAGTTVYLIAAGRF